MKRAISSILVLVLLLNIRAKAASEREFAAASAAASEKYDGPGGRDYAVKLVGAVGKSLVDAIHACDSGDFEFGLYYDIVFVVSAKGRIERTLAIPTNAYARCIASHLKLPESVAKPPADSWSVQVRVLHGPRKTEGGDLPFIIFSDRPTKEPRKA